MEKRSTAGCAGIPRGDPSLREEKPLTAPRIEAARTYQLQLAVDEIATNIILHGYKDAGDRAVISIGSESERRRADHHAGGSVAAVRSAHDANA